MKTLFNIRYIAVLFFLSSVPLEAAVLVLDSFSEGSLGLGNGGQHSDTDILLSAPLQHRDVFLAGSRQYIATSEAASGVLNYTINLSRPPDGNHFLTVTYRNPDNSLFSLLGIVGFGINIINLRGTGEFTMYVNSVPVPAVVISLTKPGFVFYPIENIRGGFSLDQLSRVGFQFIATSPDFSITLDEISAIPEPSALVLLSLGGSWGLVRLQRSDSIKIG